MQARTPEQTQMAALAGIDFPTILPLFRSPPNFKALTEWVNCHRDNAVLTSLARKLADHINYIPFEKFLAQLKLTIQHFNEKITEPYVLWTPKENGGSDLWVASLALEHCGLRWPSAIVGTTQLPQFLQQNPDIKHILLLDDAAYGGSHISAEIYKANVQCFMETKKTELIEARQLIIGIAFLTQNAIKKISQNQAFQSITILSHAHMPLMQEILSTAEQKSLENFRITCTNKTLSYHDHAYPDCWSTLPNFEDGTHLMRISGVMSYMGTMGYTISLYAEEYPHATIIQNPDEWNQLVTRLMPAAHSAIIPTIVRPYRLKHPVYQQKLKAALASGRIGQRTPYLLPERLAVTFHEAEIELPPPVSELSTPKLDAGEVKEAEQKSIIESNSVDSFHEKMVREINAYENKIKSRFWRNSKASRSMSIKLVKDKIQEIRDSQQPSVNKKTEMMAVVTEQMRLTQKQHTAGLFGFVGKFFTKSNLVTAYKNSLATFDETIRTMNPLKNNKINKL